jgi:hypothetical protein
VAIIERIRRRRAFSLMFAIVEVDGAAGEVALMKCSLASLVKMRFYLFRSQSASAFE